MLWRIIELGSKLVSQANKRDWLPQTAAAALGLAVGCHLVEWLFRQTAPSAVLLTGWAGAPPFEWFSRIATAVVFFLFVIAAKRLF